MNHGEKIDRILNLEGLNLIEFSELTHIPYGSMRRYRKNNTDLPLHVINDICNVPRFAKYRNMLLSLDDSVGENDEITLILERLRELDRLDDAVDYLKYLIDREGRK